MARARLVSQKISESERVNTLPAEAALLYTWMIAHTDKYGRMKAHPLAIKNKVFPLRHVTLAKIRKFLSLMANAKKNKLGLIELYEVEGRHYLYMPGFDTEQKPETKPKPGEKPDGWRKKEGDSGIPAPPNYRLGMLSHQIPIGLDEIPPPDQPTELPTLDEKLGKVNDSYEQNIGLLTPMIADKIKDLYDTYGANFCLDAFQEAVNNNVRKMSYITAILERWKAEGRTKQPTKGKANPLTGLVTE